MRHIVGVADAKYSGDRGDLILTHALGSCLGITAHDDVANVGGMLHVMMPLSTINPEKGRANPYMFVNTGVPHFFRQLYAAGAVKRNLRVKVAGGANVHDNGNDRFAIGKRNFIVLKKIFWKNGIMIDADDVGGSSARNLHLEIGTGRVWISTAGVSREM